MLIIEGVQKVTYPAHTSYSDGQPLISKLVALEEIKDVPFNIKRIYYVYGLQPHDIRGCHAHKTLQQLFICISGTCDVHVDNGQESKMVSLQHPNEGLLMTKSVWREIRNFSKDSVFMCLVSEPYDPKEYLNTYEDFMHYIDSKNKKNNN